MSPIIRLPEDTEEMGGELEEPQKEKRKERKKWSLSIIRGEKKMDRGKKDSQKGTEENGNTLPLSVMANRRPDETEKAGKEARKGEEEGCQQARHKEEERCLRCLSYYACREGEEENPDSQEEVTELENESKKRTKEEERERKETNGKRKS